MVNYEQEDFFDKINADSEETETEVPTEEVAEDTEKDDFWKRTAKKIDELEADNTPYDDLNGRKLS